MIGIFLNRRNLIVLLMAIELMLLAVNMNFIAFSHFLPPVDGHANVAGQIFVFFVIAVAAAEVAVGLALIVEIFKTKRTIDVDQMNSMKG